MSGRTLTTTWILLVVSFFHISRLALSFSSAVLILAEIIDTVSMDSGGGDGADDVLLPYAPLFS